MSDDSISFRDHAKRFPSLEPRRRQLLEIRKHEGEAVVMVSKSCVFRLYESDHTCTIEFVFCGAKASVIDSWQSAIALKGWEEDLCLGRLNVEFAAMIGCVRSSTW